MTEQKTYIARIFFGLFLFLAAGFLAVLVRIVQLQYISRDYWEGVAQQIRSSEKPLPAMRGNIYDCNGKLLTGSLPRYRIYIDGRTEALHLHHDSVWTVPLDTIAEGLSRIIGDHTAAEYRSLIAKGIHHKDKHISLAKKPISFLQLQQVRQLPLLSIVNPYKNGLMVEVQHERVKPFGSLASRTLGRVDRDSGHGTVGLEMQFDNVLSGIDGIKQKQRVNGRLQDITLVEPTNGHDLVTTLDAELQDIVEQTLREQLLRCGGLWGCAILMETRTGEIKAISNLDRDEEGDYYENVNHAVTHVEPGSTFKTASLMACLEDGQLSDRDTFRVFRNGWDYHGATITDDGSHAKDTVYDYLGAMATSSNIALSKMVTSAYKGDAKRFVNRLRKMGLADSVPSEIPGAQQPIIRVPGKGDAVTIAKMAYGYSVELTPLQTLMFYNAIANDGKMLAPLLVRAIELNGETTRTYEAKVMKEHLCSSSTLRHVRAALHEVVWNDLGTAVSARSPLISIAGKTGTAQVMDEQHHHLKTIHRLSFVGYFPEEDPQYTCIMVMHSAHGGSGLSAAGVRRIAEKTMAYTWTRSATELALPYDSIDKPLIKGGWQKHIRRAAKGTGIRMAKADSSWVRVDQQMHAVSTSVQKDRIPNVIGWGARDAVYAIELTGMRAQLHGKGRVVSQSIEPGNPVQKGGTVYLELR